jgi:hypothetical protein
VETEDINLSLLPKQCIAVASKYRHLELEINHTISSICSPFCRPCKGGCCRTEFCVESIHSYWLRLVRTVGNHGPVQFDEDRGWLMPNGCRISAGRPPLCSEFLCNDILVNIQTVSFTRTFLELSKLISLVGKNALGSRHLVTLSSRAIVSRLNFKKLETRIAAATESFKRYKKELICEPSIQSISQPKLQ